MSTVETVYSAKGNHEKYLDGIINKQSKFVISSAKAAVAITGVAIATKKVIDFGLKSIEFTNRQIEADTRLEAITKRVTGATDAQVDSLKELAGAYQDITTVGDEATEMGQSQLASFNLNAEAVEALTGSLLDLGVATYGVDVNGQELIQTANMLGKAYTGQTGALSRVGVLLDDQQTKMLQTGDSAERVATLIDIVGQNYGDLAVAMAATPEGKIKQVENEFNDLREEIGTSFLPVAFEAKKAQLELADSFFNGGQDLDVFTDAMIKSVRGVKIGVNALMLVAEAANTGVSSVIQLGSKLPFVSDKFKVFADSLQENNIEGMQKRLDDLTASVDGFGDTVERGAQRVTAAGGAFSAGGTNGDTEEQSKAYEDLVKRREQAFQEIKMFSIAEQDRERAALNNHFIDLLETFEGAGEQANGIRKSINEEWLLQLENLNTQEIDEEQRKEDEKARIREEAEGKRRELISQAAQTSLQTAGAVAEGLATIRRDNLAEQREDLARETSDKIGAVKATTKSEKEKAKEIKKIEEQAAKERKKIALAEWKVKVLTSIGNTALGVSLALASSPPPVNYINAAAVDVAGKVSTGVILANKPRFAHGSTDASGQLRQIPQSFGGGGVDSEIGVFTPNELIVPPSLVDQAFNGGLNGGGAGQTISIGDINIPISGNADQSVVDQIPAMVQQGIASALENRAYDNNINEFLVEG